MKLMRAVVWGVAIIGSVAVAGEPVMYEDSRVSVVENGEAILIDGFESASEKWKGVYLAGDKQGGAFEVKDGKMVVTATAPDGSVFNEHHPRNDESIYAVYNSKPVSGHFYAEVEFDKDDCVGLALIHSRNGKADSKNFTSIRIDTSAEGNTFVILRDRQNGKDNVRDNTGKLEDKGRHYVELGHQYSLPFDETNKKIRIFRDGGSGFFRFYYAVRHKVHGEWSEGWMEIAPSRDWGKDGKEFFVGLYCRASEEAKVAVKFDNLKVMQKPMTDKDDRKTGFKAVQREYNWSGFFGDAIVVSFGDEFEFGSEDRKFVFWSRMNYVPAWHINNQLLYSYEFVETKGGGYAGCHEPMSDRTLRWSQVEIVEDNDVRKVIHWEHVPCNPDYKFPHDGRGSEMPEADEYWTFYPDGTAIKYFTYTPKLDTGHKSWYELMELIPIAGSTSDPEDHVVHPALHLMNLDGDVDAYHKTKRGGGKFKKETNEWDQLIAVAHFKDNVDAFNVLATDERVPETYSHYRLWYDISWHATGRFRLVHWPVNVEPWQGSVSSKGTWTAEVAHSGLMGGGHFVEGMDWDDHYKVDDRGRKYREWVSLIGLNRPGDLDGVKQRTESWMFPGKVTMNGSESEFLKHNYERMEFVFTSVGKTKDCSFMLEPSKESKVVRNPVFNIKGWGKGKPAVYVDGKMLKAGRDLEFAFEGESLIIRVKGEFDKATKFGIK